MYTINALSFRYTLMILHIYRACAETSTGTFLKPEKCKRYSAICRIYENLCMSCDKLIHRVIDCLCLKQKDKMLSWGWRCEWGRMGDVGREGRDIGRWEVVWLYGSKGRSYVNHLSYGRKGRSGVNHLSYGSKGRSGVNHLAYGRKGRSGVNHLSYGSKGRSGVNHLSYGSKGRSGVNHLSYGSKGRSGVNHLSYESNG